MIATGTIVTARTIQNTPLGVTINDSMIATGTIGSAQEIGTIIGFPVQQNIVDTRAEISALLTEAPARTGNSALELIRSSKMSGSRAQ
eukprot:scaffold71610_cov80-Phaeocystis_antarctica.AAC.1